MNLFSRLVVAGLALATASCSAPPQPLSIDARVAVRPDAGVVVATPPNVTRLPGGLTRVSIEIRNRTTHDLAINCIVDWFGADLHPEGGLSADPMRVAVPAAGAEFCQTISPNASAVQFRASVVPVF